MFIKYLYFIVLILSSQQSNKVLWSDAFNYPDGELPPIYWSEGCKGMIKNGKLYVDADTIGNRMSTVWLDKEFSADIMVEFDVRVISSSDTVNNINFFFMYSYPSGQPLRKSAHERRSGDYKLYHKLNGYIYTNVTKGNESKVRYRFRDNPGFNLLDEVFIGENRVGETHHIRIIKQANRFQYWTDEQKVIDTVDNNYNPLHERGILGLRTWHTALCFDNLMITKLNK